MTQQNGKDIDQALDRLFQAAREQAQPPTERLMQAVLRDAASEMLRPAAPAVPPARGQWFRRVLDGLGGWQSVTALAVSACAGLWIGYVLPDSTDLFGAGLSVATGASPDLSGDVSDADYTLYSDIEDLLTEGS